MAFYVFLPAGAKMLILTTHLESLSILSGG